ncbi:MAG TPA: hypothetical protein PLV68_11670, partial [Ilumatobacteraceae bacterium]|nr:hypothetical protein [Ilumatobacteraceae bacterium]
MDTPALDQLRDAVAAVLALDTTVFTAAELEAVRVAVTKAHAGLGVATAQIDRDWLARGAWSVDGSKTPAHRLANQTCRSRHVLQGELVRAVGLDDLPQVVVDAVVAGEVPIEVLDACIAANTPARRELFHRDADVILNGCRGLLWYQARRVIRHWVNRADDALTDPTKVSDPPPVPECGYLFASKTTGKVVFNGELPEIPGAIVTGELDRIADE